MPDDWLLRVWIQSFDEVQMENIEIDAFKGELTSFSLIYPPWVTLLRHSSQVEIDQLASSVTANNIEIWRLIYDISTIKVTIINEMIMLKNY